MSSSFWVHCSSAFYQIITTTKTTTRKRNPNFEGKQSSKISFSCWKIDILSLLVNLHTFIFSNCKFNFLLIELFDEILNIFTMSCIMKYYYNLRSRECFKLVCKQDKIVRQLKFSTWSFKFIFIFETSYL